MQRARPAQVWCAIAPPSRPRISYPLTATAVSFRFRRSATALTLSSPPLFISPGILFDDELGPEVAVEALRWLESIRTIRPHP